MNYKNTLKSNPITQFMLKTDELTFNRLNLILTLPRFSSIFVNKFSQNENTAFGLLQNTNKAFFFLSNRLPHRFVFILQFLDFGFTRGQLQTEILRKMASHVAHILLRNYPHFLSAPSASPFVKRRRQFRY